MRPLRAVELCAGAGGQSLGLELAGFAHAALVELDPHCCNTLRLNRPHWNVIEQDMRTFDGAPYQNIDLLAAGLPCPPFSVAGKQLGDADERNLFPDAIRLIGQMRPRAVMIENVRGILDAVFDEYRADISGQISALGYQTGWRLLNASDYGVPQLRPRVVFLALRHDLAAPLRWPEPSPKKAPTVAATLQDLLSAKGWCISESWRKGAELIAPTLVGGSKKHGGPDLGPTRAKKAWAALGIDGMGIANSAPERDFVGMPRLTLRMVARLQGFPDSWNFSGGKTAAYRQIGNAFPPPVATAVAKTLRKCLSQTSERQLMAA